MIVLSNILTISKVKDLDKLRKIIRLQNLLRIQDLRAELYRTINENGINSKKALEISQKLDLELNKYRQTAAN